MVILTSNESKLNEFKRILPHLKAEKGVDIKEVLGNVDEVIIHKSNDCRKFNKEIKDSMIVEDTILYVNGKEIVEIRWKLDDLKEGDTAEWITSIGVNDGKSIKVYRGVIKGIITKSRGTEGFAFDPYFIPEGYDLTLAELDKIGKKDETSARQIALHNLNNDKELYEVGIIDIKPWEREYQNED